MQKSHWKWRLLLKINNYFILPLKCLLENDKHKTDLICRSHASNGILSYATIHVFPSSITKQRKLLLQIQYIFCLHRSFEKKKHKRGWKGQIKYEVPASEVFLQPEISQMQKQSSTFRAQVE